MTIHPLHSATHTDPGAEARVHLAAALRMAVLHELDEGIDNHFTVELPGRSGQYLILPFGMHWSEARASALMVFDESGHTLEGQGVVELSAQCIHAPLHRITGARVVLHTHQPWALALNMLQNNRLVPATQTAAFFHGQIAYDDEYTGLAANLHEGERLASMLGGEPVQIMVVKDQTGHDRFQLIRKDGTAARNLSDGERTAIAFSYFLTKLQEIKPAEFKETIVYIDDPISSLDANHIFQVTAAIRALFFIQQFKNAPWETTCKQIFISTHNFEFFNLLREIKPKRSKHGERLLLVKRISGKSSTLEMMPASLARYQSEYHFLFEIIHRFNKAPDKTSHEVLMLLPNAMRRFVELYTYSRLPGPKDEEQLDQRAEVLFGVERAKRILKIFHYFSHGNTLDRLAGNNELIFDLEHAVRDLIDAIAEIDKPHMDSLIAATQP